MIPSKPEWPFDLKKILRLEAQRKSNDKQIWIVGCSFAHGLGIQQNFKFGQLVADKLELPCSFLTRPGSSIDWAADQILRSDIRTDDIVIWGITGANRFTFFDDFGNLHNIVNQNFNDVSNLKFYFNIKFLLSNHMIYSAITKCEQVRNFLEKLNVKFIFGLMPLYNKKHDVQMINYCTSIKNGLLLFDHNNLELIDTIDDGIHPGIMQNKWYAETVLNHYNILYQ